MSNQGGNANPRKLTFDVKFALVASAAWHRYANHLHKRLGQSAASVYVKVVSEHTTRIQRLAEGFAAFGTSGVHPELFWLSRPSIELFSSQCLLQFGDVKHHSENRMMTQEEKAQAYYAHGDFTRWRFLEKHPGYSGTAEAPVDREQEMQRLEEKLARGGWQFSSGKPWHRMPLGVAFSKGMKARKTAMGETGIEAIQEDAEMIIDYSNYGIHGSSITGTSLHQKIDENVVVLRDVRGDADPPGWTFQTILAVASVEMLAFEYDEAHLINAMLQSADQDMELHKNKTVGPFPTVMLPFELGLVREDVSD